MIWCRQPIIQISLVLFKYALFTLYMRRVQDIEILVIIQDVVLGAPVLHGRSFPLVAENAEHIVAKQVQVSASNTLSPFELQRRVAAPLVSHVQSNPYIYNILDRSFYSFQDCINPPKPSNKISTLQP